MRKTKLNDELRESIIKDIELGLNYKDVCKLHSISEDSFYDWIKRGLKDSQDGKKTVFSVFSESVEAAKLKLKKLCLRVINADLKITNAKTAIWVLQTKYKKEYGNLATGDDEDEVIVNENVDKSLTSLKELKNTISKLRENNANK